MSLPATDTFTGSDGTSPPNANWTNQDIGVAIKTNAVASASGGSYGFSYWSADVFNNDQYAFCTNVGGQNGGPVVRASGTNNCYFLDENDSGGSNTYLFKRVAGGYTVVQTFGLTFAGGDVGKISVSGTTIKCFKNGAQIGTDSSDSSLASGSAGIMSLTSPTLPAQDTWEGGNVGAAAAQVPYQPWYQTAPVVAQ